MRLKQLLGMFMLLAVSVGAVQAAASSQLTQVRARAEAGGAMVSIQASGAFTHTAYRPAENLLLVDLIGVSPAALEGKREQLRLPGVESYHVSGYRGASGVQIARVEITLDERATVDLREAHGSVTISVKSDAPVAAATPAQSTVATAAQRPQQEARLQTVAARPAAQPARDDEEIEGDLPRLVQVRGVTVKRGRQGLEFEIQATGPISPRTMTLTGPDRIVVDVVNAVPTGRPRAIPVNSGGVVAVRMARFRAVPPTTRIVLDLEAPAQYELVPMGNRAIVRLLQNSAALPPIAEPRQEAVIRQTRVAEPAPSLQASAKLAPVASMMSQDKPVAAVQPEAPPRQPQEFVVVQAEYKAAEPVAEAAAQPAAVTSRAAQAASHFVVPQPEIPVSNHPADMRASIRPAAEMPASLPMMQRSAAAAPAPIAGTCITGRYTGEPISVNLKEVDVRDFFRLVHEISGFNVVLDPNVRGSLTLVLEEVPWDQALAIVLKNNGFECQVEGNVLRIATRETLRREAEAQRAQMEAQALAVPRVTVTRHLSYAQSKDVVPTLRRFLSQRGEVTSDDRTNALIISDIPDIIPNVDQLLRELDRKTQEVEIEARVVAATRSFARDIGTQFGFGLGNRPTAFGGASGVGQSPVQIGGLAPRYIITGSDQIPLFSNLPAVGPTSGFTLTNATNNYRLDFILTMAESRGLLKILSRPRVVTQNNIRALVKQGVRIPIVTAAQLGGPPTTTYVEAALRLTVTPQITAEGTIFLDVDVENTTPDFGNQVNGQPTLITQQATTQVLVNDGGTVMIGGVIQTQNSVSVNQVPLLGDIPLLGNLFRRRAVSTSTQELIFFITPKIMQT